MAQIIPNFLPEKMFDYSANVHTCCMLQGFVFNILTDFTDLLTDNKCYYNMQMMKDNLNKVCK